MPLPSKKEICKKCGISREDFEVLTFSELPSGDQMQREGVSMRKLGWWENAEVWLKTTIIGGAILAVCFIGSFTTGIEAISKYGPIVLVDGTYVADYVSHYTQFATVPAKGFLVYTPHPPTVEDKLHADMVIFSTGSHLLPLSGSWHRR